MPQIIEVNGENVEFPDGMSDDQIAAAITASAQPAMSQQQMDSALPVNKPTNMGAMPNGMALPRGVDPAMVNAMNNDNAQSNQQNQAIRQDPGMMQKIAAASDDGFLSNAGKSLMHTVNQFGTGAEDLIDKYLPNAIAQPLNYRFGGDLPYSSTAEERMAARKSEMEGEANDQAARSIGAPLSSTLGSMAPYLVTGGAINRGLDAIVGAASPITKELVATGLNKVSPQAASRFINKPRIPSEFSKRAGYMAKAPVIGAVEGGVNYDQSAGEGALASTAGATLGLLGPLTKLSRVENVRDANGRAIIRQMDADGMALTPGVRTGNRQMQTEEAGIRNSDALGGYYHQTVTRPNQRKMTEFAGDAIGLNGKGRDTFSSDELKAHMDNLRSQYGALESNTTGTLTNKHIGEINNVLNDFKRTPNRNTGPKDSDRYKTVKSITSQIFAESSPVTSRPGSARIISGTQYQQFRQRIQDEASQAFRNGDNRLGTALNKIKSSLDDSIENGMGRTKAAEWKDLNERYAMTNLLLKNGVTPSGAIDPSGVTSAVMRDDEAIRTLTGQGGRIKQLQKIAKYSDILNDVEGGSLTGLGKADMSADRSLVKSPLKYRLPLYARGIGAYRLGNLPVVNPTIGFGPTAGAQVGRAIGMTEPLDKINRAAQGGIADIRNWLNPDKEETK